MSFIVDATCFYTLYTNLLYNFLRLVIKYLYDYK